MKKKMIDAALFYLPFIALYFGLQALVQHVDGTQTIKSNLDAVVLNCLPRAANEQALFGMVQQGTQTQLVCERHRHVGYGEATKPAVRYIAAIGD